MNQKLNFYQCIQLLSALAEKKIIQRDPENKNNILVHRSAGTEYPEGFYSQNLLSTASELGDDEDGQSYLVSQLEEATGEPAHFDADPFRKRECV